MGWGLGGGEREAIVKIYCERRITDKGKRKLETHSLSNSLLNATFVKKVCSDSL